MTISNFDELIAAARAQAEPQRLLFVFTKAELPDDCTPEQRASFKAGNGGALTPLACVDKSPEDLRSFDELLAESKQFLPDWTIVFVAAIAGEGGRPPRAEDAEAPLNRMVEMIKLGSTGSLIPLDAQGDAIVLGA